MRSDLAGEHRYPVLALVAHILSSLVSYNTIIPRQKVALLTYPVQ